MAKAKKSTSKTTPAKPESFEESLSELEKLTELMEEENLPLGEMVKAFERGQDLLNFCQKSLTSARESIELIEAEKLKPAAADHHTPSKADPATTDDDVRLF